MALRNIKFLMNLNDFLIAIKNLKISEDLKKRSKDLLILIF